MKLTSSATATTSVDSNTISNTSSTTKFAGRLGFGMQTWIAPHWAVNLNFIHTFYPDLSTNAEGKATLFSGFLPVSATTKTSTSDLGSNTLLFAANYYFNPSNSNNALLNTPKQVRWQGFFTQLMVGMLIHQYHDNLSALFNTSQPLALNSELDESNLDGQASLFLGYGGIINNRFYVAIRGFVNIANRSPKQTRATSTSSFPVDFPSVPGEASYSQTVQVEMRDVEWGADLLPGYLLTPQTLVHLIVGFAGNRATLNSAAHLKTTNFPVNPSSINIQAQSSASKNTYGLRLGIGLQEAITNCIRMTADYVYTDYDQISLTQNNNVPTFGSFANAASSRLHSQAIMLGILIQM